MNAQVATRPKPIVLIILDGLGIAPPNKGNAVTLAKSPHFNTYWSKFPHCYLQASGSSVGLPLGVQGNSEVGHVSLGAGKAVFQEIAKIDNDIGNKIFFKNPTFQEAINHIKSKNGKLHLMGLVSPGKVHSSMDHLFACLEFCRYQSIPGQRVFIHAFSDGRDTSPQSAKSYLEEVDKKCRASKIGRIASVIGRYFAMDRDERWDRTRAAYELIVYGKGKQVTSWKEAIDKSYEQEVTDEYISPYVIIENAKPIGTVTPGDAVIFFNYRADRAVQLSHAFEDDPFSPWQREKLQNVFFAGFSNYEKGIPMNRAKEDVALPGGESEMVKTLFQQELKKTSKGFPNKQIFPPERIPYSLGRIISEVGFSQLRITESEKFPHVTYFFNCRESAPFKREDRLEIPSPRDVPTYDKKPEMSSYEITNTLLQKIEENIYDFIVVNFACSDMVAHTGNLQASIQAIQVADMCSGKIVEATLQRGGEVIITSDHGNAEELINLQTGGRDTEHSTNPVPFIYISNRQKVRELPYGIVADIAPTILTSLGIVVPNTMTGRNLLA